MSKYTLREKTLTEYMAAYEAMPEGKRERLLPPEVAKNNPRFVLRDKIAEIVIDSNKYPIPPNEEPTDVYFDLVTRALSGENPFTEEEASLANLKKEDLDSLIKLAASV